MADILDFGHHHENRLNSLLSRGMDDPSAFIKYLEDLENFHLNTSEQELKALLCGIDLSNADKPLLENILEHILLLDNGHTDILGKTASQLLKLEAQNHTALSAMGRYYEQMGELSLSEAYYTRAAQNSSMPGPSIALASYFLRHGNDSLAEPYFIEAIMRDDTPPNRLKLAIYYARQNKFMHSIPILTDLLDQVCTGEPDPLYANIVLTLAACYFYTSRPEQGRETILTFLSSPCAEPTAVKCYIALINYLETQDSYTSA